MAKAKMNLPLAGRLGHFSIYQIEGIPKAIIRAKGGPKKEQIANDPQYSGLRRSQSEFSGAGKAIKMIMATSKGLNHLADYSFAGMISKICRKIQQEDKESHLDKRALMFSKHGNLLEGLNFSQRKAIDSVLPQLPSCTISREQHKALVKFPALFPEVNLLNPWDHPLYRLLISFGMVQDMVLTERGYEVTNSEIILNRTKLITDWHSINTKLPAQTFELTLPDNTILDENSSLVLAVGVEFGNMITNRVFQPIKKAGSGKIIGVG